MIKRKIKTFGGFVLGSFLLASCSHTPLIPVSPVVSFSKNVQPLIIANCSMSGCHSNTVGGELFPLMTYNDIASSDMVSPGNAKSSRLYTVINGAGGESSMPPVGQLGNDDVLMIYLWIEQGAKNN